MKMKPDMARMQGRAPLCDGGKATVAGAHRPAAAISPSPAQASSTSRLVLGMRSDRGKIRK